ncbi:hypothetical protein FJ881_21925 [Escherichia albertii]|uniref:Uncharacterized protein n=1 Tax=Escherichia albertii TaxID=208962 RepID=A0ABD7EHN9_ESCAL|nr:hypothetical protein [Escherichia albertii]EFZ2304161.1 hypothetical protein [Shigella boydii]CTV40807.1 Uncharacterised protein [Escherichia coli]EEW3328133.1 hypothetical protein [Escherichia albertii]EFB1502527.1 hypothetical protein [Escherichia albertii]EFF0797979.1 hypothetical protein [Escherichia albertii]
MMISALKEIEMQFCLILRLCVALMAKADKKVVIFFHYMIDVRFLSNEKMTKTMIFLSVLSRFRGFYGNRTGG